MNNAVINNDITKGKKAERATANVLRNFGATKVIDDSNNYSIGYDVKAIDTAGREYEYECKNQDTAMYNNYFNGYLLIPRFTFTLLETFEHYETYEDAMKRQNCVEQHEKPGWLFHTDPDAFFDIWAGLTRTAKEGDDVCRYTFKAKTTQAIVKTIIQNEAFDFETFDETVRRVCAAGIVKKYSYRFKVKEEDRPVQETDGEYKGLWVQHDNYIIQPEVEYWQKKYEEAGKPFRKQTYSYRRDLDFSRDDLK